MQKKGNKKIINKAVLSGITINKFFKLKCFKMFSVTMSTWDHNKVTQCLPTKKKQQICI